MTKKRIKKFVEDGSLIGGFQMNNKVQKMVSIAMLAAIGTVLQFVAFPIMPAFSFLKSILVIFRFYSECSCTDR